MRDLPRPARADARDACAGRIPSVPGEPRRQAMVFQRPVLLRRSVLGNLLFALAVAGVPRRARARASAALERVGLAGLRATSRRACSRAASSSGSRSRARGCSSPRSCSSTSRPRTSTPARRARSSRSSSRSTRGDQDRDDHAQPRPGPASRRRDRVHRPRPHRRTRAASTVSSAAPPPPKPTHSSRENCHGVDPHAPLIALVSSPRLRRSRRAARAGQVDRRRIDDVDRAVGTLRPHPAAVHEEDRHRRQGRRARHRPGARRRPPRRRRRRVRARPRGRGQVRRRRLRRRPARRDVQRLRADRPEVGSGENRRQQGHRRGAEARRDAKAPFVSRGDKSGTHAAELRYFKDAGVDPAEGKGAGIARRAPAWGPRSTPPRR